MRVPTFGVVDGDKIVGGLRIKKTTSSEGTDTTKNMVKEFEYTDFNNSNFSSGVVSSKISALYNLAIDYSDKIDPDGNKKEVILRNDQKYENMSYLGILGRDIIINEGNMIGVPANNQNSYIVYKNVKLKQAGIGYSKYKYITDEYGLNTSGKLPTYPPIPEASISVKSGHRKRRTLL